MKDRADVIPDLRDTILDTWRTSNRVTVFLVEQLPPELWAATIPGAPRRTIRMIAGHLHNSRCMWIKTLGQEQGVPVPRSVDRRRVGRKELVPALQRSSRGIQPAGSSMVFGIASILVALLLACRQDPGENRQQSQLRKL